MPKKESYSYVKVNFLLAPFHQVIQRLGLKKDGFRTYFNAQHLLIKLNPHDRTFLDYLIEHSDMENKVYVDVDFKVNYCKFLKDKLHLKAVPNVNKLGKALEKFVDLGLIMREQGKNAFYRISPKYFWKGSEASRVLIMRELIESRAKLKLPISGLIDKPEEEFLKNMST